MSNLRPLNPYIAGTPLRGQAGFFGRQDILEWVTRELRNPATNALVLSGQRRIGKTSVLLQLSHYLPGEEFYPVYFDLQNQSTRPLGKVLADLADKVAEQAGFDAPAPEAFDDRGRFFQHSFIPQLYQALQQGCRPVFLLDEFDVLDQGLQVELAETVAAKALFPFLRQLMEDPRLAFIFVVGRQVDDLSLDFSATFKTSLKREIWLLDAESAEKLIRQAEANGTLRFEAAAVQRIFDLTNGHPYLTQLLCQRIWQRAYSNDPLAVPVVRASDVAAAIPEMLEVGEHALTWLWNGLGPAEKIYAAALAEIAQEDETIPEDRVIQVITANARRLRTRDVERAPLDLVKRNVLERDLEHEFRFAVAIFQQWIKRFKPLNDVKDEIDRIEPVADRLFSFGWDFFERRKWEDAIRFFRDALQQNPVHFKARLYLGEALLMQEKYEEGVKELEEAYQADTQEGRLSLARGLTLLALAQEQAENESAALVAVQRALEISPNEQEARAIKVRIWIRRGDAALKRNDLRGAEVAYKQAGSTEKLALLQKSRAEQEYKALLSKVKELQQKEDWGEAIAMLEKALATRNADTQLAGLMDQARQHQALLALYRQGEDALQQPDQQQQAAEFFLKVMEQQPGYKAAAKLLLKAVTGLDVDQLASEAKRSQAFAAEITTLKDENKKLAVKVEQLENEVLKYRSSPKRSLLGFLRGLSSAGEKTPAREAAQTGWVPAPIHAAPGEEPPVGRYIAAYKLGDDLFDDSFSIDAPSGEFLGECGVGISTPLGVGEPKQIAAFEIWLFDKNDIQTVSKVMMSEHLFHDQAERRRLAVKGEAVLATLDGEVVLETQSLRLVVRIVDMAYGAGALPPNSTFDLFILDLAVWQR